MFVAVEIFASFIFLLSFTSINISTFVFYDKILQFDRNVSETLRNIISLDDIFDLSVREWLNENCQDNLSTMTVVILQRLEADMRYYATMNKYSIGSIQLPEPRKNFVSSAVLAISDEAVFEHGLIHAT